MEHKLEYLVYLFEKYRGLVIEDMMQGGIAPESICNTKDFADDPIAALHHIIWMCGNAVKMIHEIENPDDKFYGKMNRWLGFIQCYLIIAGMTTIDAERDATRGMF